MTIELEQLYADFFPEEAKRRKAAKQGKFVHYTSAEVAMSILTNKEVWMRNARTMNDYSEIEYGSDCLQEAVLSKAGREMEQILSDNFEQGPNFYGTLQMFIANARDNTYLSCISEHNPSEDELGRLSMWRAYGGTTGVAIVVNNTPFTSPTDALRAYTFPVTYCKPSDYIERFRVMRDALKAKLPEYRAEPTPFLRGLFMLMRYSVLCTKHPGFGEELEWRIVYDPISSPSPFIPSALHSVRGVPQRVCKLQLRDIPEAHFFGASIPDLVDRIIIGPTSHPQVMYEAFVQLLKDCGVANSQDKVRVSDIPLRHFY